MLGPIEDRRNPARRQMRGRRRYPRVRLALDGYYESQQRSLYPRGGNINLRGAFVQTPVPDPEGTQATIRVKLPDHVTMIRIPARVVWSNSGDRDGPTGMGLRFEGIKGWQLKAIAATMLDKAGLHSLPAVAAWFDKGRSTCQG